MNIEKYAFSTFEELEPVDPQPVQAEKGRNQKQPVNQGQPLTWEVSIPEKPLKTFEEGFEAGFQKGLTNRLQEREEQLLKTMQCLEQQMQSVVEMNQAQQKKLGEVAIELSRETLNAIYPFLMQYQKIAEADLKKNISLILRDMKVKNATLYVNSTLQSFAEMRLPSFSDVSLQVCADDTLSPGDCRIEWGDTRVECIKALFVAEIQKFLEGIVGAYFNKRVNE